MMRALRSLVVAAACGALTVVGSAMEPGHDAAAQTVEGNLKIVKTLRQANAEQVAWSSDGRYLAMQLSGVNAGYAVWDVQSGRKMRELHDGYGEIGGGDQLEFADATHLIVRTPPLKSPDDGSRTGLALWNVETGGIDRVIPVPSGVHAYAVSAPARRMVVLTGRQAETQILVFDMRTWEVTRVVSAARDLAPTNTAFSIDPSGRWIAAGGKLLGRGAYRGEPEGRLWIYDADSGALVRMIARVQELNVSRLAFLGASGRIATTMANQEGNVPDPVTGRMRPARDVDPVRIWDIASGVRAASFLVEFSYASSMPATADGRFLGIAADRTAVEPSARYVIWDVNSGAVVGLLRDTTDFFDASAFSPDNRHLAVTRTRRTGDFEVLIVEVAGR